MGYPFRGRIIGGKQEVLEYREGYWHTARDPSCPRWPEGYAMRWTGEPRAERVNLARALLADFGIEEELLAALAEITVEFILPELPLDDWQLQHDDMVDLLVDTLRHLRLPNR